MKAQSLFAALALATACGAPLAAHAHAKLESSEPKAASSLAAPPREIRLRFNEALEPAFSKIRLRDAADADVPLSRVEIGKPDPKAMAATVPALKAGRYTVQWSALTHDGHITKGEFTFTVK